MTWNVKQFFSRKPKASPSPPSPGLLPFSPDWRWMLERRDTPWYPTATLYRQPAPSDWRSVLTDVRQDLLTLT